MWYIATVPIIGSRKYPAGIPRTITDADVHRALLAVYVNSLLATLNTRKSLRNKLQGGVTSHFAIPLAYPGDDAPPAMSPDVRLATGMRAVVSLDFRARTTDPQGSNGDDAVATDHGSGKREESV